MSRPESMGMTLTGEVLRSSPGKAGAGAAYLELELGPGNHRRLWWDSFLVSSTGNTSEEAAQLEVSLKVWAWCWRERLWVCDTGIQDEASGCRDGVNSLYTLCLNFNCIGHVQMLCKNHRCCARSPCHIQETESILQCSFPASTSYTFSAYSTVMFH